ncbi:PadR family transcriptional regulator [Cellulomonas sp. JZ18]|uniref:PadR family transcriptional regulator n=1 Tax=Cellulomonas sp. JZ18 TaxID=2654191 RepID=UPI0018B01484|nr:PadR family transcriptional regulator [Cellulomonas sp. JZ18]
MLALALLARAPSHGYALIADLRAAGVVGANGGTVYPLLRSLEKDGLVESAWDVSGPGPARKVFRLTDLGAERLAHDRRTASDLLEQVSRLGLPE